MPLRIEQVDEKALGEYAAVPIAFQVRSILRVERVNCGMGGIMLSEEPAPQPYIKDYDAFEEGGPAGWPRRFDLANWGIFIGYHQDRPACAAAVAYDSPGIYMLAGRKDLAVLWDIRVSPELRRSGLGTRIFTHAADWGRKRGALQMKIETQNVNVPACRFYLSRGCSLGEINLHAYANDPRVAHEAMLVWYLDL